MQGITFEKRTYQDKDGHSYTSTANVPFNGTQSSVLAGKLRPPAQPNVQKLGKRWFIACFFAIYMFIGGLYTIYMYFFMDITQSLQGSIGPFIISGLLIWWCVKKVTIKKQSITFREQEYPKWQKAKENWEKLYYCHTDSTIFIPGKNGAPVDKMMEYIYSE